MGKKAGAKGKGKKETTDPVELANIEKLRHAEVEVLALQQQLEVKEHETVVARRAERDWRGKLDAFSDQLTQQREDTLDITADVTRQYKTMQDRLLTQIESLERDKHELGAMCKEKDQVIHRNKRDFEDALAHKDLEMAGLRQNLEDMAQQFSDMLKETLDKMSERLGEGAPHA
eukprot:CAMPEP_0197575222 /NCGR_PEP_ID=MMETSP1326-20131121/689_1 /TAXON_ID=1155430 /ORGANISM="Genus nov. species nov., Strain RCC2288" /LENGTH=173 /DNA_ID=CAMNT_0043137951 /DNA_START=134 /DNA_END=655 /DNA_ORIENTATION=+